MFKNVRLPNVTKRLATCGQKTKVSESDWNTVKNINGYLITIKLWNKKLIRVRLFSGAKVICMYDHVKPTIREFDPNHIILHVGKNEIKSRKTAGHISKPFNDLQLSLKWKTNTVTISLVVPQKVSK